MFILFRPSVLSLRWLKTVSSTETLMGRYDNSISLDATINLLVGVWPPSCATAPPPPSSVRAVPLAMITMRKSTHGCLVLSCMNMGLR